MEKTDYGKGRKKREKEIDDNEIKVTIDETGNLVDYISSKRFPLFLLGVSLTSFFLIIGIFLAIKVMDISQRIPDILTNKYGVVINTEPEKRVCYFLLNSVQHWAKTGITVQEGDLVSVYASGAYNTAIHHVIDNAKSNKKPDFNWVTSEGVPQVSAYMGSPSDSISMKALEKKDANLGALLMKIDNASMLEKRLSFTKPEKEDVEVEITDYNSSIITIGEGRSNIRIDRKGELEFCINEVNLSKENIRMLRKEYIKFIYTEIAKQKTKVDKSSLDVLMTKLKPNLLDAGSKEGKGLTLELVQQREKDKEEYLTGGKPEKLLNEEQLRCYNRIFELEQYYMKGYDSAWYDDNLGSILVVVEIEKY